MRGLQEMSAFASSDEGARGFVTDLAAAARAPDAARWERLERELVADEVRFELALTFEGNRQLGPRVIPGLGARASQLRSVLASMREPLHISLRSATGETFADGAAHGFHPAIASVRQYLRPAVRFVRAEITDAGGQRTVIEPMAWLAGRWTWLGEPWTALPATTPAVAPSRTTQR